MQIGIGNASGAQRVFLQIQILVPRRDARIPYRERLRWLGLGLDEMFHDQTHSMAGKIRNKKGTGF